MPYDDRESSLQGAFVSYTAYVAVNVGDGLVKAALTYKANLADADPGALQKIVTTSNVAGTGQITDDGSTDGQAVIRFDITGTNSLAMSTRDYWFDVACKTASGAPAFGAGGIWHFYQPTTMTVL